YPCYLFLRYLHPFPTRRSSDLTVTSKSTKRHTRLMPGPGPSARAGVAPATKPPNATAPAAARPPTRLAMFPVAISTPIASAVIRPRRHLTWHLPTTRSTLRAGSTHACSAMRLRTYGQQGLHDEDCCCGPSSPSSAIQLPPTRRSWNDRLPNGSGATTAVPCQISMNRGLQATTT